MYAPLIDMIDIFMYKRFSLSSYIITNKKRFRPEEEQPIPPKGAHNYILLILDSCRYDSLVQLSCQILESWAM